MKNINEFNKRLSATQISTLEGEGTKLILENIDIDISYIDQYI